MKKVILFIIVFVFSTFLVCCGSNDDVSDWYDDGQIITSSRFKNDLTKTYLDQNIVSLLKKIEKKKSFSMSISIDYQKVEEKINLDPYCIQLSNGNENIYLKNDNGKIYKYYYGNSNQLLRKYVSTFEEYTNDESNNEFNYNDFNTTLSLPINSENTRSRYANNQYIFVCKYYDVKDNMFIKQFHNVINNKYINENKLIFIVTYTFEINRVYIEYNAIFNSEEYQLDKKMILEIKSEKFEIPALFLEKAIAADPDSVDKTIKPEETIYLNYSGTEYFNIELKKGEYKFDMLSGSAQFSFYNTNNKIKDDILNNEKISFYADNFKNVFTCYEDGIYIIAIRQSNSNSKAIIRSLDYKDYIDYDNPIILNPGVNNIVLEGKYDIYYCSFVGTGKGTIQIETDSSYNINLVALDADLNYNKYILNNTSSKQLNIWKNDNYFYFYIDTIDEELFKNKDIKITVKLSND